METCAPGPPLPFPGLRQFSPAPPVPRRCPHPAHGVGRGQGGGPWEEREGSLPGANTTGTPRWVLGDCLCPTQREEQLTPCSLRVSGTLMEGVDLEAPPPAPPWPGAEAVRGPRRLSCSHVQGSVRLQTGVGFDPGSRGARWGSTLWSLQGWRRAGVGSHKRGCARIPLSAKAKGGGGSLLEPGSDPHRAYGQETAWWPLPLMLQGRRDG